MKRFLSICTLAAAAACTAAPSEPESSASAAYKAASTTAEAQEQAVQLMRDISEAQASAIDQLYADSSEMDPPNPTDALVLAIAAAVIDYSFARLADRAIAAVITQIERSEEDAAASVIRAAFGDLARKAGDRVKGKMDALINGYRYSPTKAFFVGTKQAIQSAASEDRLDLDFSRYTLPQVRAVVEKLHAAYVDNGVYDLQYKTTLREYCLLLAQTANGTTKSGADLRKGGKGGVLRVEIEIDGRQLVFGDYSEKPRFRGLSISGLNATMRRALDTPHATSIYAMALPLYLVGVYQPSAQAPVAYDQPSIGFQVGRNEGGEIFFTFSEVPYYTESSRDFLVYLARHAGHQDSRDADDGVLVAHAKEGAGKLFDEINRDVRNLPEPGK